jgi:hypothetical protein
MIRCSHLYILNFVAVFIVFHSEDAIAASHLIYNFSNFNMLKEHALLAEGGRTVKVNNYFIGTKRSKENYTYKRSVVSFQVLCNM